MKRILSFLLVLIIAFGNAEGLSAYASEMQYPINPMLTKFNNEIIASWINPEGLLKTELYSVEDYTDTLLSDDFSVKENEAVEYRISNLENGTNYMFRLKYYYQSGEVYSLLLSERPSDSTNNGMRILGNWVIQPGIIPFEIKVDNTTGYNDNSSIHISVNRETKVENERMFLRYDEKFPAGEYVVRVRLKYNEASNAKAYINGNVKYTNGTNDWSLFEKKISLSKETNSVFYVYIDSKTKDYWIDDFEIHKIENGAENPENLAKKSDAKDLMEMYSPIAVPSLSVQGGNASARIMWNTYGLDGCKIKIYDKESGVLKACVSSRFNSLILRDLLNGETYSYIVRTENTSTAESEEYREISVTPSGTKVTLSESFINHSVNDIQYIDGRLRVTGKLSSGKRDESVTLTVYKNENLVAFGQTETGSDGVFEFSFSIKKGNFILNISSLEFDTETTTLTISNEEDIVKEIDSMRDELKDLLAECETKGISTDYEKMAWRILERDSVYFRDDIKYGQNLEWDTRFKYLSEIFEEASENLRKYIEGTASPKKARRTVTGENGMTENYFYSQTTEGVKPVYYMGYSTAAENIQYMKDFGFNYAATSVEPTDVMNYGVAPYWTVNAVSEDVYVSDSRLSIKQGHKVSQFVWVKKGESYTFGAEKSGDGECSITLDGMQKGTYTADDDKAVEFIISGVSGESVIENAFVTNEGKNLLKNSDFSLQDTLFDEYKFTVSMKKIFEMKEVLKKAEEDGVAICLNLSLHRIPSTVSDDATTTSDKAVTINPTHPRYLNSCEIFIRELLSECKDSKALHDLIIYNEPTFYANKSNYYNSLWREYLKENGADENLQMPSDEDKKSTLYTLYMKFNDSIMTTLHKTAAEYIRKYSDNALIHTKIMQYIRPYHGSAYTRYSNDYESWAKYFDVNGCDAFSMYFDKDFVPLSTEEAWYDYMRSVKKTPVINSEDHIIHDQGKNELITNNDTEKDYIKATMLQGAFHQRGASAVWTYSRSPYYLYFEEGQKVYINSNITLRPDVQYALGKISLDINRLSEEITHFANNKKQAAILFSPVSLNYLPQGMNIMTESYDALLFSGIGAEFVAEGRMDKLDEYEMLIVPCADYVSDDVFEKIKAYAENGGKVYIVGKAFTYDENENLRNQSLSGANVQNISIDIKPTALYLSNSSKRNIKSALRSAVSENIERKLIAFDADGNESDFVEYSSVREGKYTYINLCNHSEEEKTVQLLINGEPVEDAYEMISDTYISDANITLAPYEVMLIRKENVSVSAKILEDEDVNTYKAVFTVKGNTKEDNVLLVLASFDENGVLSGITTKAAYDENASEEKILRLKAVSPECVIAMAINATTLTPYIEAEKLIIKDDNQ